MIKLFRFNNFDVVSFLLFLVLKQQSSQLFKALLLYFGGWKPWIWTWNFSQLQTLADFPLQYGSFNKQFLNSIICLLGFNIAPHVGLCL